MHCAPSLISQGFAPPHFTSPRPSAAPQCALLSISSFLIQRRSSPSSDRPITCCSLTVYSEYNLKTLLASAQQHVMVSAFHRKVLNVRINITMCKDKTRSGAHPYAVSTHGGQVHLVCTTTQSRVASIATPMPSALPNHDVCMYHLLSLVVCSVGLNCGCAACCHM